MPITTVHRQAGSVDPIPAYQWKTDPRGRTERLLVRLCPDDLRRLEVAAAKANLRVSYLARMIIQRALYGDEAAGNEPAEPG